MKTFEQFIKQESNYIGSSKFKDIIRPDRLEIVFDFIDRKTGLYYFLYNTCLFASNKDWRYFKVNMDYIYHDIDDSDDYDITDEEFVNLGRYIEKLFKIDYEIISYEYKSFFNSIKK